MSTKLDKSSIKKLLLGTCVQTAFTFDKIMYKKGDAVRMGSTSGLILANFIMTELDGTIIKLFINHNAIKFYGRYVDVTLLVI